MGSPQIPEEKAHALTDLCICSDGSAKYSHKMLSILWSRDSGMQLQIALTHIQYMFGSAQTL